MQRKLQQTPATPNATSGKGSFFKKNISSGLNFLRKSSKAKDRNPSAANKEMKPWQTTKPEELQQIQKGMRDAQDAAADFAGNNAQRATYD